MGGAGGHRTPVAAADRVRAVGVAYHHPARGTFGFAVSRDVSDADHAAASMAVAAAADLFPGLRVDAEVIPGYPVQVLLGCAAGASMLVVGSGGAGRFAAMMLGSVSRCIATSSPCPAVVARGEPLPVRGEIVIGVREPERAAAALRFGFEEASLRQCRLLAVHARGSPGLLEDTVQRGIDPVAATAVAAERLKPCWPNGRRSTQGGGTRGRHRAGSSQPRAVGSIRTRGPRRARQAPRPGLRRSRDRIGSARVLGHAAGPVAIIPDR
jgi:nucleotide-binding universal stress UspA family protein